MYEIQKDSNCLSEIRGLSAISRHSIYLPTVGGKHLQFATLPFGLSSAHRLFTKVLAPVLALLIARDLQVTGYLDDHILKDSSHSKLFANIKKLSRLFMPFGWIITFQKSALHHSLCLTYLGPILYMAQAKVFLSANKLTPSKTLC